MKLTEVEHQQKLITACGHLRPLNVTAIIANAIIFGEVAAIRCILFFSTIGSRLHNENNVGKCAHVSLVHISHHTSLVGAQSKV